ncbi:MAG: SirB1 family protein [Burkholderiaceae bacterium]
MQALDYFALLVRDPGAIPLFEAAAAIAQHAYPALDFVTVQNEVDMLAARLRRRLPADAPQIRRLQMLNHFFFQEIGFAGNLNHFQDPDNSYLHRVLQTRRGIPISLAVLYMEIAQQVGLDVQGISFPGHFLMKLTVRSGDIVLDPLTGASLSREELEERLMPLYERVADPSRVSVGAYLRPASPRDILVRMLRNLQAVFREGAAWDRLVEIQDRLLALLPDDAAETRIRGLAHARLQHRQPALRDLEAYLSQRPDAPDAHTIRDQIAKLRAAEPDAD